MSSKHSEASRARWALIPKEERIRRMRELAKKRQLLLGEKGRRKHANLMVKARKNKI